MLHSRIALPIMLAAWIGGGCTPNQENIRLRKLNQELSAKVATLTEQTEAQRRTIDALRLRSPTIATLPPDELDKVWIASGIKLGRLTGVFDKGVHPTGAGDGLRIYLTPTDDSGQTVQVAGPISVDAFDLAENQNNHLGHWAWNANEAKSRWRSFFLESSYELVAPWQTKPRHADVTIRAVFTDELTHTAFTAEKTVHISALDSPATAPAHADAR